VTRRPPRISIVWLGLPIALAARLLLAGDADGWRTGARGAPWNVAVDGHPDFRAGVVRQAIVVSLPGNTRAEPPARAWARRALSRPPTGTKTLSFRVSDGFVGPTAGHIFAEVYVNGRVVWSADVAGGERAPRSVQVVFDDDDRSEQGLTIEAGVCIRKLVTNFPIRVVYTDLVLSGEHGERMALTKPVRVAQPEPLPPDLPLPTAAPTRGWPALARIVQPWGYSQAIAVKDHAIWAARLSQEFGFNTIIMLPPNAHNAITADRSDENASMRITDQAFADALEAYRAHGFRIILYTSIMHCGHDTTWESGQLARDHPDWRQVDADGTPVVVYGQPWLCPSTPALDDTIDYTRRLIQRWKPDAVMLDNNEFLHTTAGKPTCHCASCQQRFGAYIAARFGAERARRLLGVADPKTVRIPTHEGNLFRVWIHWRNRVWAEATGKFRAALRRERPGLVLLANTQYLYPSWLLATNLQYAQEDAVLSESVGLDAAEMSAKMLLGQALARGRPLWNYLGTFSRKDYRQLRPPETIASISAASLANGARPWIVFYGFERPSPSLDTLGRHMRLARRWIEGSRGVRRWANVVLLFSLRQRDYLNRTLLPPHLQVLRQAQIQVEPLRDIDLPAFDLTRCEIVIADGIACLADDEGQALARWVRQGGTLLATPDTAWYDPIGRLRPKSLLTDHLGATPPAAKPVGEGRIVWFESGEALVRALAGRAAPALRLERSSSPDEWEFIAYRQENPARLWVHAANHGSASSVKLPFTVRLDPGMQTETVKWWTPRGDLDAPTKQDGCNLHTQLPSGCPYAILNVTLKN